MNVLQILFENDEILIINKPTGLAVQGGQQVLNSVDELLHKQLGYKVYLVHRLDKDTAGLLIVAKNSKAAAKWTNIIASKNVKKQYKAICVGAPLKEKHGFFTSEIGIGKDKKKAFTEYKVLQSNNIDFADNGVNDKVTVSLIELTLGTGRMHQIRIHLSQNNCPIVADDKYGNFKINKILKKNYGIKKLQLMAFRLTIPLDDGEKKIEISFPEHIEKAYSQLFN